jgi:hypothetical protein
VVEIANIREQKNAARNQKLRRAVVMIVQALIHRRRVGGGGWVVGRADGVSNRASPALLFNRLRSSAARDEHCQFCVVFFLHFTPTRNMQ